MLCWPSVDAPLPLYWSSVDALWALIFGHTYDVVKTICNFQGGRFYIIDKCGHPAPSFSKMQKLKLLNLRWCSFLEGSYDIFESNFALNGSWYFNYGLILLHSLLIIQDSMPKSLDTHI